MKSTLTLILVAPIKNIAAKSAANRRIKRGVEKKMKKMKLLEANDDSMKANDDKRLADLRMICHPVISQNS